MNRNQYKMLGLLLAVTTVAQATTEGFYMGGMAGRTNTNNKPTLVQTGTAPDGTPIAVMANPSNTGIGGRFFFGYNLNKYGAIEAGYTYYAPTTYNVGSNCGKPSIRTNAYDVMAKGMWPIATSGFGVFGKAGIAILRQTAGGSITNATVNPCDSGQVQTAVRPALAIGASYDISQNWVTDVSWTRVLGGGGVSSADLYALGIAYHFVDKMCGQFLC